MKKQTKTITTPFSNLQKEMTSSFGVPLGAPLSGFILADERCFWGVC